MHVSIDTSHEKILTACLINVWLHRDEHSDGIRHIRVILHRSEALSLLLSKLMAAIHSIYFSTVR